MTTVWRMLFRISPLLVDALTMFVYGSMIAWIKAYIFRAQSSAAGWIIAGFFLLLIIGVFLYRRLSSGGKRTRDIFGYPALGFGIVVFMMAIQALGIFEFDASTISDTAGGIFTLIFLALIGLYLAAVLIDPQKKIAQGTPRSVAAHLFSLLAIALAVIMAGAYWEFAFFESERLAPKSLGDTLWQMLWMYPIFVLFFASPRLLALSKNLTWYGLISAFGSMGYYVWVSIRHIQ